MWEFLLIDLQEIVSSVDRADFSESELDSLAGLIIEMKGNLYPAILKKIGFERYEIISGHLEYYASLIAHEREPRIETLNAFVINQEGEENANQQIKLPPSPIPDLESYFNRLERRLETCFQELNADYKKEFETLALIIQPPPPPPCVTILESLNTCTFEQIVQAGIPKKYAENLIRELKKKKFASLKDIVERVEGVAEKRLVQLMDFLLSSRDPFVL